MAAKYLLKATKYLLMAAKYLLMATKYLLRAIKKIPVNIGKNFSKIFSESIYFMLIIKLKNFFYKGNDTKNFKK